VAVAKLGGGCLSGCRLPVACRPPLRAAGFPARRGFLMRLVIIIARLIALDDLVALVLGTLVDSTDRRRAGIN